MKSKLNEERRKAAPQTSDLENKKEVWKNGEVAPSGDGSLDNQTGSLGRVADAGDIGGGSPSVYGGEIQAETVAKYTEEKAVPRKTGGSK